jgi:hypothetical protein
MQSRMLLLLVLLLSLMGCGEEKTIASQPVSTVDAASINLEPYTVIGFRPNTDAADYEPIRVPDRLVLRILEARSGQ